MSTRALVALAAVPLLAAGIALTAVAQVRAPMPQEPVAATDRIAVESTFAKADANGDGRITREEATALPAIAARFDQLDRNKDGVLSLEEFGAGYAATD